MQLTLGKKVFVTKSIKIVVSVAFSFLLIACGRSPDPTLYLLNPIAPKQTIKTPRVPAQGHLRLGIERITLPSYLTKTPTMILHQTPHRLGILDNYQWGDNLDKMVQQVITANLQALLPGAIIENYPWSSHLHPNYYLQVTITDFKMMFNGKSILRAHALVYTDNKPVRALNVAYEGAAPSILLKKPLHVEALVKVMNQQLTRLSQEMSIMLRKLDFSEHHSISIEHRKPAFRRR
ncbi:MAG: membrane integrity-associated transporter subunit PqiC [Legionella sp.]|nr:membrane integrity-associated transporter subunit PqiC [Legionella sp.]